MDATAIVKILIVPNQNQAFVIHTALFAFAFCSSPLEPVYLFFVDVEHLFAGFLLFPVYCYLLFPLHEA